MPQLDMITVAVFTVTVAMPSEREIDGVVDSLTPAELEAAEAKFHKGMRELDLKNLIQTTAQNVTEEHFLTFKPSVEVTGGPEIEGDSEVIG